MLSIDTRYERSTEQPIDRFKSAKRWLLAINLFIVAIAGLGAFVAQHVPSSATLLFKMTAAAKQLIPLDSWTLKSNFHQVAQVYDLLALPLVVTSTAWFFALLYLPPKGNLATPYKTTQRALGVFAAALFVLLAVFAPIVEEGQDVTLLHTGTSSAQLMLFGWYPFATVGLLLASAAVILWKSITGK